MKKIFILPLLAIGLLACEPFVEPDVELGSAPVAKISATELPGDPNRIVFTDQSENSFIRSWTFGNGASSGAAVDTVYYPFAGEYTVTLAVSGKGGTATDETTVVVAQNDPNACSDTTLRYLAGGCVPGDSAVWVFSQVAGAITVGPTELSTDWYTSPAAGLVPEQYDDSWVFYIENNHFQYFNNGSTIDPYQGYISVPLVPATDISWTLSKGTGYNGADQIILPDGTFIGTMDSGPVYDIISISETELTLMGSLVGGGGWFTFYLVRQ